MAILPAPRMLRAVAAKRALAKAVRIPRILLNDALNKRRHGRRAPVRYQQLYCDPFSIETFHRFVTPLPDPISLIPAAYIRDIDEIVPVWKAVIAPGDWDRAVVPLAENRTIQRTRRKLAHGLSWEEVGEIDRLLAVMAELGYIDSYFTRQDLDRRIAALDALVEEVRATRRLKEVRELNRRAFREEGGLGVYVARDGSLIKSTEGLHRLAIAHHFKVPAVPVCVEAVHVDAVTSGAFERLLRQSDRLRALALAPRSGDDADPDPRDREVARKAPRRAV